MFWWPDAEGGAPSPHEITANLTRFTINPKSTELNLPKPEILLRDDSEFYRIDDPFSMKEYTHCFFDLMDQDLEPISPPLHWSWAVAMRHTTRWVISMSKQANMTSIVLGRSTLSKIIPRSDSAKEGDGWIMVLVNNYGPMSSELHIVDTNDFSKAQAIVHLPIRLRAGLHGNWVDRQDIGFTSA